MDVYSASDGIEPSEPNQEWEEKNKQERWEWEEKKNFEWLEKNKQERLEWLEKNKLFDNSDHPEEVEMKFLNPDGKESAPGPNDHDQGSADWSEEWEEENIPFLPEHKKDNNVVIKRGIPGNIKMFGERNPEYTSAKHVFEILVLEDEYKNPFFVKWLMDKKEFGVKHTHVFNLDKKEYGEKHETFFDLAKKSIITDKYELRYRGIGVNEEMPFRRFEINGGAINAQDHTTAMTEIREFYDQYRKEELNKILKKAGIATAVGVTLISIITGLSLGLKRKGNDLVRNSKETQWSKIVPGKKIVTTPWSEIEYATGEGFIFIGNHIYLVIGGTLIYLYTR